MTLFGIDRRIVRSYLSTDLLAILLFGGVGEYRHGLVRYDAVHPEHFVTIVGPFVLAWLVLAALFGGYTRSRPAVFLAKTIVIWIAADILTQLLSYADVSSLGPNLLFFAVAGVFGGLFLLMSRGAVLASRILLRRRGVSPL